MADSPHASRLVRRGLRTEARFRGRWLGNNLGAPLPNGRPRSDRRSPGSRDPAQEAAHVTVTTRLPCTSREDRRRRQAQRQRVPGQAPRVRSLAPACRHHARTSLPAEDPHGRFRGRLHRIQPRLRRHGSADGGVRPRDRRLLRADDQRGPRHRHVAGASGSAAGDGRGLVRPTRHEQRQRLGLLRAADP